MYFSLSKTYLTAVQKYVLETELVRYGTLRMNTNNSKPRYQQEIDRTYNQEIGCLFPYSYCFMISFLRAD